MKTSAKGLLLFGLVFGMVSCQGGGCNGCNAPAAKTPMLVAVLKPGPTPTNIVVNSVGQFEVLPSPSVIVQFTAPYPTSIEVEIGGVLLEQTSDVSRQQALGAAGAGFWFISPNYPDVNVSPDPKWEIVVAPPPEMRTSPGFQIRLTDVSPNTNLTGTAKRSNPLDIPIAIGPPDWVNVSINPTNDNAVVLLDSKRATGCADDEIFRGRKLIDVGDVLWAGNCNSEVSVFTTGAQMQFLPSLSLFTNNLRDYVNVILFPQLVNVPVTFWVLSGPFAATSTQVRSDAARATTLYGSMRCGTTTGTTAINNATASPLAASTTLDCPNAAALRATVGFTPGQINAYYINNPTGGWRGATCDPNTLLINAPIADNESLAHELGHSFSLGHTNAITGISTTNLMVTGGVGRNSLTIGQCFRCNVNLNSSVNTNNNRGGPRRNCPDSTTSSTCPALALDAQP